MSGGIENISYKSTIIDETLVSSTRVIDVNQMDHFYRCNYEGNSGAIKSDTLLLMMMQIETKYDGQIYLDYVDDTNMKYIISHENIDQTEKIYKGVLTHFNTQTKLVCQPNSLHQVYSKCIFKLTWGGSNTVAHELDIFRIKR